MYIPTANVYSFQLVYTLLHWFMKHRLVYTFCANNFFCCDYHKDFVLLTIVVITSRLIINVEIFTGGLAVVVIAVEDY